MRQEDAKRAQTGTPAPFLPENCDRLTAARRVLIYVSKCAQCTAGKTGEDPEALQLLDQFNQFHPEELVVNGPYTIDQASITNAQFDMPKNEKSFFADKAAFDKIVNFNGETDTISAVVLSKDIDYATHGFPPATEQQMQQNDQRKGDQHRAAPARRRWRDAAHSTAQAVAVRQAHPASTTIVNRFAAATRGTGSARLSALPHKFLMPHTPPAS